MRFSSTGFSLWGFFLHAQRKIPQAEACATKPPSQVVFPAPSESERTRSAATTPPP